jgi:hypothetical protein
VTEQSLAELVPLWRTVREKGVTALVTPALDFVGGLELGTTDVRFVAEDIAVGLGEGVRTLVSGLDDDCTLLFLYRVHDECNDDVRDYQTITTAATTPQLQDYVASRARWLSQQKLRRTRLFVFFCPQRGSSSPLARGQLGLKLLYKPLADRLAREQFEARFKELAKLRDRLSQSFLQRAGVTSRELSPEDMWRLHYELLNPTRARKQKHGRDVVVRDDLWSEKTIRAQGEHLREYTEAEQLCFENVEDRRGYFRHGDMFRRVATLKVLPEGGTPYFAAAPIVSLGLTGADGERTPFAYTVAVAVQIQSQGVARWKLSMQHGLVDALRNSLPFLQHRNVAQDAADRAKQASIERLFEEELTQMSSKLVNLSVSVLLEARSLDEIDAQTEATRSTFGSIGNSELLDEDVTQIPAFLSMLPGSGPYQLRRKGCTSRNAADFLPLYAAWRGTSRCAGLLSTPEGDGFRLDLFDKKLATAHHGLVVADTGSGKSFSLGLLTLDALAAGIDAILIDNGNSWKPLTEVMGGTHIPVDLKTSISPFAEYAQMVGQDGQVGADEVEEVVNFITVCSSADGSPGFDLLQRDVVSRAVRRLYETDLRTRPDERPLMGDFQCALQNYEGSTEDQLIARTIARRLAIYCDGEYAEFLNRPSRLRFDARLVTFDLQSVSKTPATKKIAIATIMQAVADRAARKRNRTLVEADEAHEHLADEVGARFFEGCYRKMRKYDVAMWMISQRFTDFVSSKSGEAIIGNSKIRIFLRHDGGHEPVIDYFRLSPLAAAAFRTLSMRPGHYSDLFLMYGQMQTTVRLAPHPLAYWLLTTDPEDRRRIDRAVEKNPLMDRLSVLSGLAARWPHGALRAGK